MTQYNIAVVGVTGAVGTRMLEQLEESTLPIETVRALASKRSAGKIVEFKGQELVVEELTEDSFENIDIALFSAGGSVSEKYAPYAVKAGAVVVDNTSFSVKTLMSPWLFQKLMHMLWKTQWNNCLS